jgi:hypothetical protein
MTIFRQHSHAADELCGRKSGPKKKGKRKKSRKSRINVTPTDTLMNGPKISRGEEVIPSRSVFSFGPLSGRTMRITA